MILDKATMRQPELSLRMRVPRAAFRVLRVCGAAARPSESRPRRRWQRGLRAAQASAALAPSAAVLLVLRAMRVCSLASPAVGLPLRQCTAPRAALPRVEVVAARMLACRAPAWDRPVRPNPASLAGDDASDARYTPQLVTRI